MKKLQRGFSALELIMVMAVSAVMMTTLLEIYNHVTRNMLRIDRLVFEDTQLLTLRKRFEQDLSGLSAIWFTQADLEKKKAGKVATGKSADVAGEQGKKTSQYFYSLNKNKNLDTLTFVTTSALQSYGSAQSHFVRVVYKVEQDPAHAGLMRLMRKEIFLPTENIDEQKNAKEGSFYELVGGIKSLEMTYQLIDTTELKKRAAAEKESSKDASKSLNSEAKPIIRSVTQWTSDNKKSPDKNDNNKKDSLKEEDASAGASAEEEDLGGAAVPKFVTMKIVFGATNQQLEKEYKLDFYISSYIDNMVKLPKKQPVAPEQVADDIAAMGGKNS